MYKPDDHDIDHLSREAAELYNAPGTSSWEALRRSLDKEMPQEKKKRRRGFLFFLLLGLGLLLAGSVVWYGVNKNKNTVLADKPAVKQRVENNAAAADKHITGKTNHEVRNKPAETATGKTAGTPKINAVNNKPVTASSAKTAAGGNTAFSLSPTKAVKTAGIQPAEKNTGHQNIIKTTGGIVTHPEKNKWYRQQNADSISVTDIAAGKRKIYADRHSRENKKSQQGIIALTKKLILIIPGV